MAADFSDEINFYYDVDFPPMMPATSFDGNQFICEFFSVLRNTASQNAIVENS